MHNLKKGFKEVSYIINKVTIINLKFVKRYKVIVVAVDVTYVSFYVLFGISNRIPIIKSKIQYSHDIN